jgi:hypothetical protein
MTLLPGLKGLTSGLPGGNHLRLVNHDGDALQN